MGVLYILIPLALILGGIALVAFLSALKKGQFEDLETPAWRAIFDDKAVSREKADESGKPF